MDRDPLKRGTVIYVPGSGSEYRIDRLVGEGGFSLVYTVLAEEGQTADYVIKEYYPADGAFRDSHGVVRPAAGREEWFYRNRKQFEQEGILGGEVGRQSFQTVHMTQTWEGYAVMPKYSGDMCSVAELVSGWEYNPPHPYLEQAVDPCFTDQVRVRYAMWVADSVLAVLGAVHRLGLLHLDISGRNVIWAGQDRESGQNCAAFLADFGCAAQMKDGQFFTDSALPCSRGFAAPEVLRHKEALTPASDLYSVGILLFYLCVGSRALERTCSVQRQIRRETAGLKLSEPVKTALQNLLVRAAAENQAARFQSAQEMQEAIRNVEQMIPVRPVNPDNTSAFTLYSLRAMLTGKNGSGISWADELCDRRKISRSQIPEEIGNGITWKNFENDEAFLKFLLPEELYGYLNRRILELPDRKKGIRSIMSGNYAFVWKQEICQISRRYGLRRLLQSCRTLLNDETQFMKEENVLFAILGKEGGYLNQCMQRCGAGMCLYIGLALLAMYALLGKDGFEQLIRNEREAQRYFYRLE